MENLYLITSGKVADSGHVSLLVKAKCKKDAIEIVKNKTIYHLGLNCEYVEFNKDNFCVICDYDNPYYEG